MPPQSSSSAFSGSLRERPELPENKEVLEIAVLSDSLRVGTGGGIQALCLHSVVPGTDPRFKCQLWA